MRLATKRALDYRVGRPLLAVLDVAARVLGWVLRRDHSLAPVRSILIVKFQGLGSLVVCKPAIAELRRQYPDARFLFWGAQGMLPLAEQMPEFDEVIVLDDRTMLSAIASTLAALIRLWRARIDWALDLEVYSRLSSVLITLTMARNRAGFALDDLRSRRVHTHLIYFNRYQRIGRAYARLAGQLLPEGRGVDIDDYGTWRFTLDPLPDVPRPYLLFNLHAGDLSLERRWPRESFHALVTELLRLRPDAHAVFIGHGDEEVAYTAPVGQGERRIDLSGKLDLVETIRAVANADLVVTSDSAPLHFARSTGARVVGLFGPTRPEAYMQADWHDAAEAHVPIYCSPCVHHWEPPPCGGDNQCMKRLGVTHVLERCCMLLNLPMDHPEIALPEIREESDYYPGLVYSRRSAR